MKIKNLTNQILTFIGKISIFICDVSPDDAITPKPLNSNGNFNNIDNFKVY